MKCGVGDYTYELANALAGAGEVHVGVLTSEAAAPATPGSVEVLPDMRGWGLGDALQAARILRLWKPDIVHVQYPTQGYRYGRLPTVLPMIARLRGISVVNTWHEPTSLRGAASFLLRALAAGRIIVVRPGFRQALHPVLRAMLFSREPIFIPNASSISRSPLDAEQQRRVREAYLAGQQRLIVFFGFVYPFKGVDLLLEIADPSTDRIVVAGELDRHGDYGRRLVDAAQAGPWAGKVRFTGFLEAEAAAHLLAAADAVILPFRRGGGEWNSSIHAAVANGAYVITTSERRRGFDAEQCVHYSPVDDVLDMKNALSLAAQRKAACAVRDRPADPNPWQSIAKAHVDLYKGLVGSAGASGG
jgi:glycosyltransferase involved in cell wall biosynthesis